jgi:D-alanine-D-alanine ligase-like ATP-grasp enzyme
MPNRSIDQHLFFVRAILRMRCAYYSLMRRGRVRVQPGFKRMEGLRRDFYARIWRKAAEATGAQFRILPDGRAEIERDGRRMSISVNATSLNGAMTLRLAESKATVHSVLARSGIPVPKQIVVGADEFEKALHMLQYSRLPLVVKPYAYTGGGEGVSTNIATARQLRAAFAWACSFESRCVIEEQVEGDCYRVLVMDGKVLDTIVRHPPTIKADGISTVAQLIRRENNLRLEAGMTRAHTLIGLDPDLRNTLASQGLSLRSCPAAGRTVVLKRVINENSGRENVPANGRLCSAILDTACKAAEVIGARLAGVDVICRDPNVPLERSGGAIIEINGTPGFYYHYAAQSTLPVADEVLNKFFDLAATQQ